MFWKRVKAFFTGKPSLSVHFNRWYWTFGFRCGIDWAPGYHFDALFWELGLGPLEIAFFYSDRD